MNSGLEFIVFKKPFYFQILLRPLLATVMGFTLVASQIAPLSAQSVGSATPTQIGLQLGHSGDVTSIAISPDNRAILTGSTDNTVRLWDTDSGRELRQFIGHAGPVNAARFSPDGKIVLTGGTDSTARLWDAASGRELRRLSGHTGSVNAVAFLPGGLLGLTASDDKTVRLWDIQSGRELRKLVGHTGFVNVVAISPDSRTVLTGSDDLTARLWDVGTGRLLRQFEHPELFKSDGVKAVAFSRSGREVLTVDTNNTTRLWDAASGRLLRRWIRSSGLIEVTFSPSGHPVGVASEHGDIRLWDLRFDKLMTHDETLGSEIMRWIKFARGRARAAAFSLDGRLLLTGGDDKAAKLWDVDSGKTRNRFTGRIDTPVTAAFSPDGRSMLTSVDNTAWLEDTVSGRRLRQFVGHNSKIIAGSISLDSRTALTGSEDRTARLWDIASGRELSRFVGHANTLTAVAFSPDGDTVLTASVDKTARLWNAASGHELVQLVGHTWPVFAVAFSPDSRTVLTGGADKTARLWDVVSGRELRQFTGHSGFVNSITFSPNGSTMLTGSTDGTARLWDVATGQELRQFAGHTGSVIKVAFSTDGRAVLTGSADNTARLWDAASGRQLHRLVGHSGPVNTAVFSLDGQNVQTRSHDGTTRLWNVETGAERASIISFADGSWLTITPEGFFDVSSPQAAQNLNVVRGLEASSIDQVYNTLYRPDLVREKLAGDPNGKVKAAAAQLDLDKVMASGMAPKVAIVSPTSGSSSAADEAIVEAAVTDQGGGIGKVEWRINGVTLGLEARGLERIDAPAPGTASSGRIETVKRSLSLEPGENRIEIVAYNAKGLIASEPAQTTIRWDGSKTATPPKLYVLAIGVNDYYDSRLRLTYAVPDATALAEGFRKAGNGLYASVEVKTVLDKDVTLTNLDKIFAEMSQKVQPRDVFVFFLAGHGKTKNGRYYFLPRDFRYQDDNSIEKAGMGQDKFQAWFASIPARKSLLLYDTCESGSLTGANARGSDIDERMGALNRMARATGRTFLTATTDDAPALEGFRGHGVFTYALLDALDHADINKNGLIEVSELADYIDQKVPDYSFEAFKLRQIPQRSIVGNNFALANKAQVLAEKSPPSKADAATISPKPTHVVVALVEVRNAANNTAASVLQLKPGTQVRLLETANGWVLIARDGQKLGYVTENAIAGLQ